jgi:hypothetical protein
MAALPQLPAPVPTKRAAARRLIAACEAAGLEVQSRWLLGLAGKSATSLTRAAGAREITIATFATD